MNLLEEFNLLATDEDFCKRVRMGMVHVAKEVLSEPPGQGSAFRNQLAIAMLKNESMTDQTYVAAVAIDDEVGDEAKAGGGQVGVSDETILAAIRRLWNPLCGNGVM